MVVIVVGVGIASDACMRDVVERQEENVILCGCSATRLSIDINLSSLSE